MLSRYFKFIPPELGYFDLDIATLAVVRDPKAKHAANLEMVDCGIQLKIRVYGFPTGIKTKVLNGILMLRTFSCENGPQ